MRNVSHRAELLLARCRLSLDEGDDVWRHLTPLLCFKEMLYGVTRICYSYQTQTSISYQIL